MGEVRRLGLTASVACLTLMLVVLLSQPQTVHGAFDTMVSRHWAAKTVL